MALAVELDRNDIDNYEVIHEFAGELGLADPCGTAEVQAVGIQVPAGEVFNKAVKNWVSRDGNVNYETHAPAGRVVLMAPARPPLPGVRMLEIVESPPGEGSLTGLHRVHFNMTRLMLDQTIDIAAQKDIAVSRSWSGKHKQAEILLPEQPGLGVVMHDYDMEKYHLDQLKKQAWLGFDVWREIGGGVSYHRIIDDKLLEKGASLTIEDFYLAAGDGKSDATLAAKVFNKLALTMTENNASPEACRWLEMVLTDAYCVRYGSREHIVLSVQAVKDLYDRMSREGIRLPGFGTQAVDLLKAVLEDE